MELLGQVIIALITTSLGSVLTYLAARKNANTRIEEIRISSDTELNKIREESKKEIDRIRVETEEKIRVKTVETELASKEKEESLKYEAMTPFMQNLIKDPKKGVETIKGLQELAKMFPSK